MRKAWTIKINYWLEPISFHINRNVRPGLIFLCGPLCVVVVCDVVYWKWTMQASRCTAQASFKTKYLHKFNWKFSHFNLFVISGLSEPIFIEIFIRVYNIMCKFVRQICAVYCLPWGWRKRESTGECASKESRKCGRAEVKWSSLPVSKCKNSLNSIILYNIFYSLKWLYLLPWTFHV